MHLFGCAEPVVKTKEVKAEAGDRFEADLESMRQQMKIPGKSAAVVKDGNLAWARGFGGLQIVERQVILQCVGGDFVAVLVHETRQRVPILDRLQPVLRGVATVVTLRSVGSEGQFKAEGRKQQVW